MRCPRCGTDNSPDAVYCRRCALPLGTQPPASSATQPVAAGTGAPPIVQAPPAQGRRFALSLLIGCSMSFVVVLACVAGGYLVASTFVTRFIADLLTPTGTKESLAAVQTIVPSIAIRSTIQPTLSSTRATQPAVALATITTNTQTRIAAATAQPATVGIAPSPQPATVQPAGTPTPTSIPVSSPTPANSPTPILNLPPGRLRISVLTYQGQLAESSGRLGITVYPVRDHASSVAVDYRNPAEFSLSPGHYDIRIEYYVATPSPFVGGTNIAWLEDLEIASEQTLIREHDLKLGVANLQIREGAQQPAQPQKMTVRLFRQNELTASVAYAYTDTFSMLLPAGTYVALADYQDTNLFRIGPIGQPFTVVSGQTISQVLSLGLGHIKVTIEDGAQPLNITNQRLALTAYPSGKSQLEAFSQVREKNPLDVPVQGGVVYDLLLEYEQKKLLLTEKTVKEGDTLSLSVKLSDFK